MNTDQVAAAIYELAKTIKGQDNGVLLALSV